MGKPSYHYVALRSENAVERTVTMLRDLTECPYHKGMFRLRHSATRHGRSRIYGMFLQTEALDRARRLELATVTVTVL